MDFEYEGHTVTNTGNFESCREGNFKIFLYPLIKVTEYLYAKIKSFVIIIDYCSAYSYNYLVSVTQVVILTVKKSSLYILQILHYKIIFFLLIVVSN